MNEQLRIFITGVSASLMGGLVSRLSAQGHTLIGLSRSPREITGVKVIQGDLLSPDTYTQDLKTCDMLIHAAALTHSHKTSDYQVANVDASSLLLAQCPKDMDLVFLSSRAAGPDSGAYGRSKWEAEKLFASSGKRFLILSPSEVFGVAKGEGIEQLIRDAMTKKILPYPNGVNVPMSPIHAEDLCERMFQIILAPDWPESPVILNGPESMGFPDFFQIIRRESGHSPILIPIPKWMMRSMAFVASVTPGVLPFTSDQVARLYAPKKEAHMKGPMSTLGTYVRELKP